MIFGHFLFVFNLHRSFGKLHPFFTVRFTGFTRPTERMCQLITQPHPPGRPNRTINVFLWCALFNYLWDHYGTQIAVAPLLSRPKWRLIYWVQGRQGGGGGGACMVKSFSHSQAWIFPLVLLLKLIAGELHFYTWKKALSPEWKGFPLWKHRKRALGNGKNFPVSPTNFCRLGAGNLQRPSKKR